MTVAKLCRVAVYLLCKFNEPAIFEALEHVNDFEIIGCGRKFGFPK